MSLSIHGENVKNSKEQSSSELLFVEIRDPTELRRNILESLKGILEVLQSFEKFKHIRAEKLENIAKLRSLMKDANRLMGNLKAKLPQTNIKATTIKDVETEPREPSKEKKFTAKKSKSVEQSTPRKEASDIKKLESELNAIESKLRNLT